MRNHKLYIRAFCVVGLLILCGMPFIGMQNIPFQDIFMPRHENVNADIFWRLRVPRTCLAFLTGGGLAVCGMVFQAIFKNPLATPFTLGVSSGASLGAVLYVYMGFSFMVLGLSGSMFFALLGAILSIVLVYGVSVRSGNFNTTSMLLSGVAVSLFFSSLILCVQYLSDFQSSFRIVRWLMGGLETVGYKDILQMLSFLIPGMFLVMTHSQELNLLTLNDDIAASRGVNVTFVTYSLFFAVSMMIGGIVSVCGPIGFVGMMIPHICRLLTGPMHETLAGVSFLAGGVFLVLCDTIGRTAIAPAEIPVGVITSLFGGPFFLWLLMKKKYDGQLS